jgi:16S rRNA (adenine1518-N6/adenine1519-N6)-dimethyltransferase
MNHSEIRRALEELGIRPEKGLGQNFLVNPLAVRKAVRALGTVPLSVLEIGPGLGALTEGLLAAGHKVSAVELCEPLAEAVERMYPSVEVVKGDFLQVDPGSIEGFPFQAVASNLPYNISSQSVLRLCEKDYSHVGKAVIMLQREMASRLCCVDGGREYGRLSLMVWPWFSAEKLFDLGPEEFIPRPKVSSTVVVLTRRSDPPLSREEYEVYSRVVKAAFSSRRKKVINCLSGVFGKEIALEMLHSASIDPGLRAERIPPEKFAELTGKVKN